MLNVRFDYGFIGRLFGVPRRFLSQVGAFCASLASGHQIIDVRAPAFPDPKNNPVTIGINEDELQKWMHVKLSDTGDSQTDMKDTPSAYDSTGATATWTAGGTDGLDLDCYCKMEPYSSGSSWTMLQRCRLKFSKDGLLVSAQVLAERTRLQAKNG